MAILADRFEVHCLRNGSFKTYIAFRIHTYILLLAFGGTEVNSALEPIYDENACTGWQTYPHCGYVCIVKRQPSVRDAQIRRRLPRMISSTGKDALCPETALVQNSLVTFIGVALV